MSQMNLLSIESSQPTDNVGVLSSRKDSNASRDEKFSQLVDRHINDAQSGKRSEEQAATRGNSRRSTEYNEQINSQKNDRVMENKNALDDQQNLDSKAHDEHCADHENGHQANKQSATSEGQSSTANTAIDTSAKDAVTTQNSSDSEESAQLLAMLSNADKMLNASAQGDLDGEDALNKQVNLTTDGASKSTKFNNELPIAADKGAANKWGNFEKQLPGDQITPIKPVDNQDQFAHLLGGAGNKNTDQSNKALAEQIANMSKSADAKVQSTPTVEQIKGDALTQTEAAAKLLAQASGQLSSEQLIKNQQAIEAKQNTAQVLSTTLDAENVKGEMPATVSEQAKLANDSQLAAKQALDVLTQASSEKANQKTAGNADVNLGDKNAEISAKIGEQLVTPKPPTDDTIQPINPATLNSVKSSAKQVSEADIDKQLAAMQSQQVKVADANVSSDNKSANQQFSQQQTSAAQAMAQQNSKSSTEELLVDEAFETALAKEQLLAGADKVKAEALSSEKAMQNAEQNRQVKTPLSSITSSASLTGLSTEQRMAAEHHAALESIDNVASLEKAQSQKSIQLVQQETIAIYRKDFANAVKDKVMLMVNQKLQQIDIQLDPPELGNVHVRVNLQGEQAQVNFVVQNQQAKEAFEQSTDKLREMLAENGVDVGDTNVSQGNKEDGENGDNGQLVNQHGELNDESADQSTMILDGKSVKASANGIDYYA